MKKFITIILMLFTMVGLHGQNQYIIRCSALVGAASCGSCSLTQIGQVSVYEVNGTSRIHKGNIINSSNYNDLEVWHHMYIIIDKSSTIEFRFTDPIDNTQKIYVYNPQDGSITDNGHFYHHDGATRRWHRVNADFGAVVYTNYDMADLRSYPDESTDINICVETPNYAYIQFGLVSGNSADDRYLCAYINNEDGELERIDRILLDGLSWDTNPHRLYPDGYVIHASQFINESYYGKEIYFRIETVINGLSIFSETQNRTFFQRVNSPNNIEVAQLVCHPYTKLEVEFSNVVPNYSLDQYEFRARPNDLPEELSNIIQFVKTDVDHDNNSLTLEVDENSRELISNEASRYTLQLYINAQSVFYSDSISQHRCAITYPNFLIPERPIALSISAVPTEFSFNGITYHISRNGASDGEALLQLVEGQESRIGKYEYYENGNWQTIPSEQIEKRGEETWYIGLSAGTYQIRVVDTDGCGSEPIEFTLVEPAPLEITNLDSTLVNCHINNLGQHADGQIGIHFTGGIGPYEVEVFNEEGASVYFLEVNAEHFDEGDDICHISTHGNLSVGNYHVVVTDNSGIEDDDYIEVISNPELILSASPMSYDCYGSANGAVTLHLENREGLAVNYGLNGDSIIRSFVDTAYYDYLIEGIYTAGVINSRGCKDIVENIEIRQPNQIQINGMATNPICYNSFDGRITTNVTGGNGGYVYKWSNSETTPSIIGLNNGSYTLIITDAKGCTSEDIYTITPPVAPSANWPETSAVLCTGNTKTLDGGSFTAYQWKQDDVLLSNERYFTLEDAGVYTLELTNEYGCISTDTFTLELSDHPLDAVLLLQDSAIINELVEVIDVTWPIPDSINWYFDKQVSLESYNEWSQQFSVPEEGVVNVTLRAWYGGCFSDSTKNIVVYYSDEDLTSKSVEAMPLILGCKLWPNPNNGNFSLDVKLNEESEISVLVYSLQNQAKIFSRNYQGLKKYEIPFQFNDLIAGIYLVIVKAQNEQQSIKFIINK
jgi:hypothetical protein